MLIGLIGYKNSGKTSISREFASLYDEFDVNMIGFSNPLYDMLNVLGISREEIQDKSIREIPHPKLHGKSIQYALNTLGTDWGRKLISENIWVKASMEQLKDEPWTVNIADNIRFPNEFQAVKDHGGITVGIVNPTVCDDGTVPESYVRQLQKEADYTILNDPDLKSLKDCASLLYGIAKKHFSIKDDGKKLLAA
jgi:hypothetical protein